jgi:hypothetical protein
VGGGWVCKPISVLSLEQAEQLQDVELASQLKINLFSADTNF